LGKCLNSSLSTNLSEKRQKKKASPHNILSGFPWAEEGRRLPIRNFVELTQNQVLCWLDPSHIEEKREAFSLHDTTSPRWFHGNSIPKIGCHYFWSGPIALPKNTISKSDQVFYN